MVKREVEGPGKGWLSHDQTFQYSWKIFLATSWVLKFFKYIGKFGHVTTSLCQGLCPSHVSLQRGPGNEVGRTFTVGDETFSTVPGSIYTQLHDLRIEILPKLIGNVFCASYFSSLSCEPIWMYDGARIPERNTKFRDATDYCVKKIHDRCR